jgi:hypothetical protein
MIKEVSMKSILVPTIYHEDTLQAIEMTCRLSTKEVCQVVLLSVTEINDSISEMLFVHEKQKALEEPRAALYEAFKNTSSGNTTWIIKEHHQYGMSRPVLATLMERYAIDMAIIPNSFNTSNEHIHRYTLELLNETQCPLLTIPAFGKKLTQFNRALYLNKNGRHANGALAHFSFTIIEEASLIVRGDESIHDLIQQHGIDLVVKDKSMLNASRENLEGFRIPVLAV